MGVQLSFPPRALPFAMLLQQGGLYWGIQGLCLVWQENNVGWNTTFMCHFSEYLWLFWVTLLCVFSCQFKVRKVFKKKLKSPVETESIVFLKFWLDVCFNQGGGCYSGQALATCTVLSEHKLESFQYVVSVPALCQILVFLPVWNFRQ